MTEPRAARGEGAGRAGSRRGAALGSRALDCIRPGTGISQPRLEKRWSQAKTIGLNSLVNSISLALQIRTLSKMGKRTRIAIVNRERAERAL